MRCSALFFQPAQGLQRVEVRNLGVLKVAEQGKCRCQILERDDAELQQLFAPWIEKRQRSSKRAKAARIIAVLNLDHAPIVMKPSSLAAGCITFLENLPRLLK